MNKIKVGLWGIGRAGWNMHCSELDHFHEFFEVKAGCDIIPERADDLVKRYPGAKGYTDSALFLKDPEVELVSIAVPTVFHVEFAEAALNAGKIVFLEKPFGNSLEDAEKLIQLNQKFPHKLFLRLNRRFEAALHHLMDIMKQGILGNIYEIKLCRHRFQVRNDWQTLTECQGGQINNWGTHLIDHSLILLGSRLVDVWANLKRTSNLGTAEDHIKVVFTGENGRIVDLEISDGVAIPAPVYTVYGTRGTLISQDEREFELRYLAPDIVLPTSGSLEKTPARNSGYGGEIPLRWISEKIPVKPQDHADIADIYGRLYHAVRDHVPFGVTIEQAAEIIRTAILIRKCAGSIQIINR